MRKSLALGATVFMIVIGTYLYHVNAEPTVKQGVPITEIGKESSPPSQKESVQSLPELLQVGSGLPKVVFVYTNPTKNHPQG